MRIQKIKFAMILLSSLQFSCNPPPIPSKSKTSSSSGALQGTGTDSELTADSAVNYSNSLLKQSSTDMSQGDAQIAAEVQNSQGLLTSIHNISKRPTTPTRIDEFYKCGTTLSNGFMIPDSTPGADNSVSTLATKMKNSLTVISSDVLSPKIGGFDNYTAAVDSSGMIFVFFTAQSNKDVFYTWQDTATNKWTIPKTLTGIKGFTGLPTASFDASSKKIVVQIYNLVDKKLYTYTQGDNKTFQAGTTPAASNQSEFDNFQKANGTNLEMNFNMTLNSIPTVTDAGPSIAGRVMNDVLTLGTAEIANAVHTEDQLQANAIFADIQKTICPATTTP